MAGKIRPFRSRACWHSDLRVPRGRTLCKGENCLFFFHKENVQGKQEGGIIFTVRSKPALLVWCLDKALSRLDHSRGRHFSVFFILWSEQIALNYSTLMMYISRLAAFLLPSPLYANLC